MKALYFLLLTFCWCNVQAQYAPQAGLPGSTAISASSGVFTGWAAQCTIQRGFMDIANPSLGYASSGDSSLAIGAADGYVVSLGDSGIAVLTFNHPIYDGPGPDFAVFENGFRNLADSTEAFLELAFVEVSSDGINYFRFPAQSLTQTQTQVGNGDYLDASNLNNLAGSYIAMYGTPFDLQELSGIPGLNINDITHVRVIDVVGSINGHSSHDSDGRIINDPYPTAFPSCGFDLDAVGVIHEASAGIVSVQNNVSISIYPNPVTDNIHVSVNGDIHYELKAALTNIAGSKIESFTLSQAVNTIPMGECPAGIYYLTFYDVNGNRWVEKVIKQ